jgi:hypothetical protein
MLQYFAPHLDVNKWSIIPKGVNLEEKLKEEHNRDKVGSSKKRELSIS